MESDEYNVEVMDKMGNVHKFHKIHLTFSTENHTVTIWEDSRENRRLAHFIDYIYWKEI